MEYGYLKVTTDDVLSIIETDKNELDNHELWKQINGYYEIVAPVMLRETIWKDVRILCDDNGLLKDGMKINKVASGLYGAPSPIVGDVLFVRQGFTDDGEADIFPFYGQDIKALEDFLKRLIKRLKAVKIEQ